MMKKIVKYIFITVIIVAVISIIAINIKGNKTSNDITTEDPNANQPMGVTVTSEYEIGDN